MRVGLLSVLLVLLAVPVSAQDVIVQPVEPALPVLATKDIVVWADWIAGTVTPGRVSGLLAGTPITVTSASILPSQDGSSGQPVYWKNTATYVSAHVPNAPTTADIIKISAAQLYTITFATPVVDPLIAIVSLGGLVAVTWDFGTTPIVLRSQGPGYFGAGPLSVAGNILTGHEGHGVIQATGTFTALSFMMTTFENWVGFTVGVPQTIVLPPRGTFLNAMLEWEYTDADSATYAGRLP